MLEWLSANLATIIVFSVVLLIVGLIVFKMIKNKKEGKSSCSCGCSGCPMKNSCHSNNNG